MTTVCNNLKWYYHTNKTKKRSAGHEQDRQRDYTAAAIFDGDRRTGLRVRLGDIGDKKSDQFERVLRVLSMCCGVID
jgi:hypothetical protein